ncbi:hypothetical protein Tco_0560733, partial [Tanacetum coccineum]
KPATRRQPTGVKIKDTLGVSVSKKKAPAKAERNKEIDLLSEAALLEEAQMKKAIQRSKQETHMHQAGGSGDGAGLEPEVPDEPKGNSIDTHEGTGLKPVVPDVSKADSSNSEYESWGVSDDDDDDDDDQQGDDKRTESDNDKNIDLNKTDDEEETQEGEFVHTPDDNVPTDDETHDVDDEEYDRINEEMYDDMNVDLKDAELADEGKGDEEMTDAEKLNDELREVIQEVASAQVQDEAQGITTAAPTQVASSSRYVSSNYAVVTDVLKQQQQPQKSSADIRKIKMEQIGKQQETKYTITSSDKASLKEFDQKRTLFETMTKSKSFDKNPKHMALYHALKESILEDEDAMDKGVADKLKKRKPDDADRDEDPPARPDQGLKRRKTSKDTEPSKKVKSTDTSKGTTKS